VPTALPAWASCASKTRGASATNANATLVTIPAPSARNHGCRFFPFITISSAHNS
jgi:hypothetical protein